MTENCKLEVKAFAENSNTHQHADFLVALQCRDCGAAAIRRVETMNEVFYDGW